MVLNWRLSAIFIRYKEFNNLEIFYLELLQFLCFISNMVLFKNYYGEFLVLTFIQNGTV